MTQSSAHKFKSLSTAVFVCLVVLYTISAWVCAAPASAETGHPPAVTATLGDPQELETFIDDIMTKHLEEQHIAGAVIIIVKDGQVLLSKGYGYADVDQQISVDPEKTLFRIGSVTKLFTWTAVMQLVEQGKIDLNADINTYLTRFKIPATYPAPVTMLDLMSHTAGFGLSLNEVAISAEQLIPLGDYVAENMPVRRYPPGQFFSYSNYSAALAGYIVEQVSGEPFEQYIAAHILKPLGMDHSTLEQPLPEALAPDMAQGYLYNEKFTPYELWFILSYPAGALSAPGADMGKFMLAHLQDGQYNGARILKPETVRQMQLQSYTFDPALPGLAHGFYERSLNGRRLLSHGGDVPPFDTLLALIPEEDTGIYVSYSCETGPQVRKALLKAFMDRYFPGPALSVPQPPSDFASRARRYTGEYQGIPTDGYIPNYWWKVFPPLLQVQPGPENTLWIDQTYGNVKDTYVEVKPLVLQNTRTGEFAVFKEDERGQVRYLAVDNSYVTYVKVPWYGGETVNLGFMVFSLLTFLSTLIAAPVALILRRRTRVTGANLPLHGRLARAVALAFCVVGSGLIVFLPLTDWTSLDTRVVLAVLPWFVAVLAPAVVVLAVTAWWKRWWGLAGRLHYTWVALVALVILWFEVYWKLLAI